SLLHAPSSSALSPLSLHDALPISGILSGVAVRVSGSAARRPVGDFLMCRLNPADDVGIQAVSGAEGVQSAGKITTNEGQITQAVDRKSTRLNSSHVKISYAVFCLK